MVDDDLIADNPLAIEGIKRLAESKVLLAQMARMQEQLLSGDAEEKDESLVQKVKEFRRTSGMLQALQELGESYLKENQS